MRKHTYTNDLAPTNTGSIERPARLNLRQTCSVHARTMNVFLQLRDRLGMSRDAALADIWEDKLLLALEHINWHLKESPTCVKNFVRSLFDPLPKEDYVRNKYEQLKMRFEK